ncbi:DNA gyrase subunit A [Anaerocolumna cellulosilytica]|uniref:DNA topoisomerase (ATP-hydrolyzing) n=1 Tax=Anaerocolumna cellulosilytica TaxID=433286 RepID=A0A6S6QYH2_9FIRM|nr:DNA topoisomerase (ATP-hydrolyzing) [Anaerocolumna cellulosilytica]MBB5195738.1 DNA gyrase subunit A [Anaerocolumna cellulosilytica]BCJ92927.1 DNA gyrase subunit A [Anaerocolumna cellulosilytica]
MNKNTDNTTDTIVQLDFSEEMRNSYRDYALSVIIARALPDVRDGLKPVQRRILYAMNELGLDPKKPHRKSARIVGDTMGKYHPHGDSSIYDALVRMTEDYSLSIPLVDGHGNFGSIDGDGAAAMRYTEARLSQGAMTLLEHLDKGLVEFIPNFDDSEKEPTVLPAMIPNLLINGTTGIAVGMATNIPPHNPVEVIDGAIACLDNPDITTEKLMKYIPGPDFPTGGTIINQSDLAGIYSTGEGKVRIRSKVEIENGENGRKNIVITEIPYTVAGNKMKLVESLATLMKDKVFDEIFDVRDESSKEGIRIVVEVKKDRDIDNLLNGLYKKTPMEDTYGVNLLAVKDKQPTVFQLKSLLQEFIHFQEELYTREFKHLLEKAENRLEIVDGLIQATDVIDLIIEILRGSSSVKQAKGCLTDGTITDINFKSEASKKQAASLNFTERQADAILAMPLSKLIGLEILKLHEENDSLLKSIDEYKTILGDQKELHKVIKNRLKEYKKAFSFPRRTILCDASNTDYVEEVKIEDIYVLIDRFGYTKSLDTSSYTRAGEDTLKEYAHIILMKNTDKLCLFTAEGNMYQIKASAIPKCKIKDKGILIHNLCKVDKENILIYTSFEQLFETQLVFSTKLGYIKQVSGVEFETNRSMISATKLESGDAVVDILLLSAGEILSGDQKVIVLTEKGLSLGYALSEVSEMKKTGRGVKSIELDKGDTVVYTGIVKNTEEAFVYNGKVLSAKKVRNRKRGAKGQKAQLE